ncbi:MAG: hypothetical protein ACOCSJ_03980 [Candidatus Natronoplasma sp.]
MTYRSAEEILRDNKKGAAELLEDVVKSIQRLEKEEIESYLKTLVINRYSVTPLVNLANKIFLSLEQEEDIDSIVDDLEGKFFSRNREAATKMKKLMQDKNYTDILTLSYSSTVIQALSSVEKVKVLESRPNMEGRKTAKKLINRGIEVEYWVDAGMCRALENIDCVVVGADSISKKGFLNKIGTKPLAITSDTLEKEFYVVADTSKILPSKIPTPKGESHPPKEVWDNEFVVVKNDYFELTQLKRAEFITENGRMKPKEIKKIAEKKEVSEMLLNIHPLLRER